MNQATFDPQNSRDQHRLLITSFIQNSKCLSRADKNKEIRVISFFPRFILILIVKSVKQLFFIDISMAVNIQGYSPVSLS